MQLQPMTMGVECEPTKELERFKRDRVWFQEHQDQLLRQYPEQWVAVYNQQLVGADPDFDRLLDILDERNVPSEHAFIEKVTAIDEVLILTL